MPLKNRLIIRILHIRGLNSNYEIMESKEHNNTYIL